MDTHQHDQSFNMKDFELFSPVKAPRKTYSKESPASTSAESFYGANKKSSSLGGLSRNGSVGARLFPIFQKGYKAPPKSAPPKSLKRKLSLSPASSTAKKNRAKKLPLIESNKQYAIDAGQRDFDASTCNVCHMVYTKGEVVDEKHHAEFHDLYTKSVKWSEMKNERQLTLFESVDSRGQKSILRCVAVLPKDGKKWLSKVDSLFSVADRELGINTSIFDCVKDSSVYLIMLSRPVQEHRSGDGPTPNKKGGTQEQVAGFVAAEAITEGCRLVSESPLCVSTQTEPALLGITRMWVHHEHRRQGIATKMLDTLRANFSTLSKTNEGRIIKRDEIAFTDPTNEGLPFAKKYSGQDKFLIFYHSF